MSISASSHSPEPEPEPEPEPLEDVGGVVVATVTGGFCVVVEIGGVTV